MPIATGSSQIRNHLRYEERAISRNETSLDIALYLLVECFQSTYTRSPDNSYEPNNFFDRKEVRKYDLYSQYALIAAEQAVQDSGIEPEKLDLERVGVIWGSGIGGRNHNSSLFHKIQQIRLTNALSQRLLIISWQKCS